MSVTVEKLENLQRKIILALPWDEINAKVAVELRKTQKRAKINGFRPGKAPLKIIESMYGAGIHDRAINETAQKTFYDTVVAEKLKVAGLKSMEAVENNDDKAVFKVAAVFEVYPDIHIGDLTAQDVTKVTADVGDDEIDKTIDILRKQRARFNRVEREAQNGDRVIVDFSGKIDGQPFAGGSSENYPFLLGNRQMLPEFEAGIAGMKEGDVKEVSVTFPADYQSKDVAGKTAVFTITLKNVAEAVLPEINEDFAESLGIANGDVSKMREEIQKNVTREIKRRVGDMTKESVMNALLAATPTDVPQVLIDEEAHRLAEQMQQNLNRQGIDNSKANLSAHLFNDAAKRRVALSLVMAQLIEDEKLNPTDAQIKAVVDEFAESYEDPKEVIDWYYHDKKNLQGPTSLAIEANVVDFVLGKAKVTEKKMSFDEVMGQQA